MLSSSYRIILLCLLTVRLCLSRKSLDVRVESVDIGVYDVLDRVCDSGLRSLADTCGCVCERERGGYVFLDCVSKISKKKRKIPRAIHVLESVDIGVHVSVTLYYVVTCIYIYVRRICMKHNVGMHVNTCVLEIKSPKIKKISLLCLYNFKQQLQQQHRFHHHMAGQTEVLVYIQPQQMEDIVTLCVLQ
jgi:hypothetical protein